MGSAPQPGNDSQQGLETALNRVERLRNQLGPGPRDGQGRQQGGQGQGQANGQGQGQGQANGQGQGQGQNGGQQYGRGNQGGWSPNGGPGARIAGGDNGGAYGNQYNGGGANGTVFGNLDTGNNTPRGGPPVQPDNSPIGTQRAYDEMQAELVSIASKLR